MTAQLSDYIKLGEIEYQILETTDYNMFRPESLGLKPTHRSTICWRGFWCGYEIRDDELLLSELNINNEGDVYPVINGIEALPPSTIKRVFNGGKVITDYSNFGHHKYENLMMPVCFSGKLLLGAERMKNWGNSGGIDKYWKYKVLKTMDFQDGKIVNVSDESEFGKRIYQTIVDNCTSKGCVDFFEEGRLEEMAESFEEKPWYILRKWRD